VANCTVPMDVRCDLHRNSAEDEQILVWSMTTDLVDVAVETKARCFGLTGAFKPRSTLDAPSWSREYRGGQDRHSHAHRSGKTCFQLQDQRLVQADRRGAAVPVAISCFGTCR
jgi:hypothetical protein